MVTTPASRVPAPLIAGEGDIDTAADIVTAAFDPLAVIQALVRDPARRQPVTRAWYRLHIKDAIRGAGQVVMTDDASAVAVWFDRTGDTFREPEDYAQHLAELAGEDLPAFQHLDQVMKEHHPNDPHWHLLFLATRPGRQSKGLGGTLMDYTHARLDAERIPAYLEATGEDNQRLYERYGYRSMDPATITVSDDTVLYRMWRSPQIV